MKSLKSYISLYSYLLHHKFLTLQSFLFIEKFSSTIFNHMKTNAYLLVIKCIRSPIHTLCQDTGNISTLPITPMSTDCLKCVLNNCWPNFRKSSTGRKLQHKLLKPKRIKCFVLVINIA